MSEFLAMGGYAAFVWPCFLLTGIVLVWNVIAARRLHAGGTDPGLAPGRRRKGQAMTPRRKRLIAVIAILVGVGAATALAMLAFEDNLLYFYNPSQVVAGEAPKDRTFRVGGMVTEGSVRAHRRHAQDPVRRHGLQALHSGELRRPAAGPLSRRAGGHRARTADGIG